MYEENCNGVYEIIINVKCPLNVNYKITVEGYKPYFYVDNVKPFINFTRSSSSGVFIDKKKFDDGLKSYIDKKKDMINRINNNERNFKNIEFEIEKYEKEWERMCSHKIFDCELERKKIFRGYNVERDVLKISFNSIYDLYAFKKVYITNQNINVYDLTLKSLNKFINEMNIKPSDWIRITGYKKDNEYELRVNYKNVRPIDAVENIIKYRVLAYDIECVSDNGNFPCSKNPKDKIIQIGMVFHDYGNVNKHECERIILTLGNCDRLNEYDIKVETFNDDNMSELRMIKRFFQIIKYNKPDIITGYNIFRFDYEYIYERLVLLTKNDNPIKLIGNVGKFNSKCSYVKKELSSSALGENMLKYISMDGIIQLDLFNVIKKGYKLSKYSLDCVVAYFFREEIVKISKNCITSINKESIINSSLKVGQFINVIYSDGINDVVMEVKYKVINIIDHNIFIDSNVNWDMEKGYSYYWAIAKDDIKPREIFEFFKSGDSKKISNIGKYCIQDCELCIQLINKLNIIPNLIGFSNVCYIPSKDIHITGQGCKIISLVSKKCMKEGYIIPYIDVNDEEHEEILEDEFENEKNDDKVDTKYVGGLVLETDGGIYYDPVIVLDFNSLYPNSMICYNLSPEMLCDSKNDDVMYQQDIPYCEGIYGSFVDNSVSVGIIPQILIELLQERKRYKKLMDCEEDSFKKSLYDGIQIAYKLVANSIYGQTGSSFSQIKMMEIAQSTTYVGRCMLLFTKNFIEKNLGSIIQSAINDDYDNFKNIIFNSTATKEIIINKSYNSSDEYALIEMSKLMNLFDKYKEVFNVITTKIRHTYPSVIYGDTDSLFFQIGLNGIDIDDHNKLILSIKLGPLIADTINLLLPNPMKIGYEKTYFPFIILTKKKYVGKLYVDDPNNYKIKNMGNVTVRHDYAKIVQIMCGNVMKLMLNKSDVFDMIHYVRNEFYRIMNREYDDEQFVIRKSFRSNYKNRNIPHVSVADKMTLRDPGNEPKSGDKISYAFFRLSGQKYTTFKSQSEHCDDIDYIRSNNLSIDYQYYLLEQIYNPLYEFVSLYIKKYYNDNGIYWNDNIIKSMYYNLVHKVVLNFPNV